MKFTMKGGAGVLYFIDENEKMDTLCLALLQGSGRQTQALNRERLHFNTFFVRQTQTGTFKNV